MKHYCYICKFTKDRKPHTHIDLIYDAKGNIRALPLCYGHSVELFKQGQKTFIDKHKQIYDCNFETDLEVMTTYSDNRDRVWF
ncbi:MAG: hypothetical protein NDI69_14535 [Bacteriovoracaceae bacterium]|nr:hypothetical protein [Bacteriovoracaceae bacterium]